MTKKKLLYAQIPDILLKKIPTLLIDADSRTDTNLKRLRDLSKKKKKKCGYTNLGGVPPLPVAVLAGAASANKGLLRIFFTPLPLTPPPLPAAVVAVAAGANKGLLSKKKKGAELVKIKVSDHISKSLSQQKFSLSPYKTRQGRPH